MKMLQKFELLVAVQECLKDGKPVPLWAIEVHAGPHAAATLIREAGERRLMVTFRYPPIPHGAVLLITPKPW